MGSEKKIWVGMFSAALFLLLLIWALRQVPSQPNHRLIRINFSASPTQCDFGEKVSLHGELQVSFAVREFNGERFVWPVNIELKEFSGTGQTTGRKYVADNRLEIPWGIKADNLNGLGVGVFKLGFLVTDNPNLAPKGDLDAEQVQFAVQYTVIYKWGHDHKVHRFDPGTPEVHCQNDFLWTERAQSRHLRHSKFLRLRDAADIGRKPQTKT
jgi:hypothetical protein